MSEHSPLCVIQLTPPGRGAIVTLRVEGSRAADVVELHFRAGGRKPLSAHPVDRLVVGRFGAGGDDQPGEQVVVRRCSDGAVEIHGHGGHAAIARIEELLADAGCQRASWQTWVNDSNDDPITAAALIALAEARTERTAAILLDQYHGALRRAFNDIQRSIDQGNDVSARRQIDVLLGRAAFGQHLVRPWRVAIGGPVNVGKSSLINALVGFGRSIVHDSPGTTRDAVTASTAIDGWPVELCDTAGLRVGDHPVELAGIELAKERLVRADLPILVFDGSVPWSDDDQALVDQWPHALVVHNKCDLPSARASSASKWRPAGLAVSALRGDGVGDLLSAISARLVPNPPPPGAAVPFTDEQVAMLRHLASNVGLGDVT